MNRFDIQKIICLFAGGEEEASSSVVIKEPTGGWVTTSIIEDFLLASYENTEVVIGCSSVTKGIHEIVQNSITVKIVSK